MERATTPPARVTRSSTQARAPPTPDITRRIEESRLKAKAIRDQREASARQNGTAAPATSTVSGFTTSTSPSTSSLTSRKRGHAAISARDIPSTSRDARGAQRDDGAISRVAGDDIQVARKFAKKFVDHDFSKMTDTKGGFLTAEDDPFDKVLHKGTVDKPAHMTLKEWERKQLLDSLRQRREGPYQPGLSVFDKDRNKKCRECGGLEIDRAWEDVFKCCVCNACKEKMPEKYSLLTKTEAKDDYLLTDPELKDPDLLPHLNKPNPHKSHWHDMMLFLRYQVEEYAFSTKWGSAAALDAEFDKREGDKKKRKEDKFNAKLRELKKKTRAEAYRRNMKASGGAAFGDAIAGGKHEHEWGRELENEEGDTVKTCIECGMEVEVLEF